MGERMLQSITHHRAMTLICLFVLSESVQRTPVCDVWTIGARGVPLYDACTCIKGKLISRALVSLVKNMLLLQGVEWSQFDSGTPSSSTFFPSLTSNGGDWLLGSSITVETFNGPRCQDIAAVETAQQGSCLNDPDPTEAASTRMFCVATPGLPTAGFVVVYNLRDCYQTNGSPIVLIGESGSCRSTNTVSFRIT